MRWNPTRRTVPQDRSRGSRRRRGRRQHVIGVVRRRASARRHSGRRAGRVVVVFLRGGQDHLSTVVPYTEAAYYAARPTIAIPAAEVLDLNGQFGFHPTMTQLHDLYQRREARRRRRRRRTWPATGATSARRTSGSTARSTVPADGSGWLARYLNATSTGSDSVFRGLTVGNNVNTSLRGYPALGIGAINEFGLGGLTGTSRLARDADPQPVRR